MDAQAIDRTHVYGSTDVASIVGLSKWRSRMQVFLEKTGRGNPDDFASPEVKRRWHRGRLFEPPTRQLLIDEHGLNIVAANRRYFHRDHKHLTCEVDFLWRADLAARARHDFAADLTNGSLQNGEIKSADTFAPGWGSEGSDDVPLVYQVQSQFALEVTQHDACLFAVLRGFNVSFYVVKRDAEIGARLVRWVQDFHSNHVLADVPPEPVDLEDVRALHPRDDAGEIKATVDVLRDITSIQEYERTIDEAEHAVRDAKTRVASYMGDHALLRSPIDDHVIATHKLQHRNDFDSVTFRDVHPELFAQFRRSNDFRVLRIKG